VMACVPDECRYSQMLGSLALKTEQQADDGERREESGEKGTDGTGHRPTAQLDFHASTHEGGR